MPGPNQLAQIQNRALGRAHPPDVPSAMRLARSWIYKWSADAFTPVFRCIIPGFSQSSFSKSRGTT